MEDINIYANNILVRRYNLNYTSINSLNSLSALSNITYYGSDNASLLYGITFQYYPDREDYFSLAGFYIPSELFTDYNHVDFGIRLLDFNNDGFVDIVKGRTSTSEKKVFINNRNNNWTLSNYTLSVYIVDSSGNDNGVRFADVNNDGLVDLLQGIDSTRNVYLHNGSGWNLNSWTLPISFVVSSVDNGVQLADLNGDGKIDLLQAKDSTRNAWLNNGSGWSSSSLWQSPESFIVSNADSGARLEDINGDGLPDIIRGSDIGGTFKTAYLNNGSGWTNYSNYNPSIYFTTSAKTDNGVRFADVNGDGLTDMLEDYKNSTLEISRAYLNNGSGWVLNNNWKSDTQFAKDGYNIGRRLGDVNGDGYADIVVAYGNATGNELYTYIKNTSTSYLLKRIVNEYGGIVEINYSASTSYNNSNELGFNLWVVGNVKQNNSLTGDFSSVGNYSYSYFGGKYNYTALEFRGFNIVNETKPDNSIVSHYFHQSDALKGKEYMTEVYNSSGNLFSRAENVYSYTSNNPYYEVFLDSNSNYLYGGSSDAEITNASYAYDSYGNVVYKANYGDTSKTEDEKYERYEYAYHITSNIIDKVIKYSLYNSDNSTLSKQTIYYYDSLDFGASPTKGDLTKVSEWNNKGEDPITKFKYDSYGNVIKKIDPLGHETKYTYGLRDTSFTYTDRVTNALGHRTDYSYDLGTGNLLWEEKENIRRTYLYDPFGRISKEILPYDSEQLPTRQYTYAFDGIAPEIIKVSLREHGADTVDTYYYYDGFANLIQLKTLIENNQSVVKNIFYDGSGRVSSEQNPYFETFNSNISSPLTTINKTYYTYDALDRVIKVTNPDNSNKSIIFNKYKITDYDENSHKHDYYLDSYGRIINVIEYNINPNANNLEEIYNTSYSYDTNNNLIKITDNEGNEFKFTYDSLGRKIKLVDPDLGTWTYKYDAIGNLVGQNGSHMGLQSGDGYYREYNEFGQLIRVRNGSTDSSPILEEYWYDPYGERIKIKRYDESNTTIYTPFRELMRIINTSGTYDFIYVYDGDTLVSRKNPDNTTWYYLSDHLDSTTVIVDESGDVIDNVSYSPYGIMIDSTDESRTYTGQQYDELTWQYYYGARYYGSQIGKFLQPEPLGIDYVMYGRVKDNAFYVFLYNPQNLNHYVYALNNPYRYIDPTGKVYWDKVIESIIQAGGSMAAIGTGVGLMTGGVAAEVPTAGTSTLAVAGGVALTSYGFANIGDATLDFYAALMEDDEYFEKDKGGILTNAGNVIAGDAGALVGNVVDIGVSVGTFSYNPTSFKQYSENIASLMSMTLTIQNVYNSLSLQSQTGSFSSGSGRTVSYTLYSKGGKIVGGSFGSIKMSEGFAKKFASVMKSKSKKSGGK